MIVKFSAFYIIEISAMGNPIVYETKIKIDLSRFSRLYKISKIFNVSKWRLFKILKSSVSAQLIPKRWGLSLSGGNFTAN